MTKTLNRSIVINDFTNGLDTLHTMDVLASGYSPTHQDVWAEFGVLAKRRGRTIQAVAITNGGALASPAPSQLKVTQLGSGATTRLAILGQVSGSGYLLYTDNGTSFSMAGYTDGTVSITGTGVTGSGTTWLTHLANNDYFFCNNVMTQITSVNSDTSLTLASAPGNVGGGTSYIGIPKFQSYVGWELFDVSGAQNLFLSDGVKAYRWTGTTMRRMDNSASMPAGTKLLKYKNYLFVLSPGGVVVRWSNLKDATTWPAANSQTLTSLDNPLRSFYVYGDYIVVFADRKLFRLVGDIFDPSNPQYVFHELSSPQGLTFNYLQTTAIHEGYLKFLTSDGWYQYNGGPSIEKISQGMQPDIDGFKAPAYGSQDSVSSAIIWKRRMWCSVCTTTANVPDKLYVQDEKGKWWRWTTNISAAGPVPTDWAIVQFSGQTSFSLYSGNNYSANLFIWDTGNSDDPTNPTAINGSYDTKEFVFPSDVTFQYAVIDLKKQSAGNLIFGFSIDRRTYVTANLDMTSGAGTIVRRMVPIDRVGKAIRFQLSNNTLAQTFEVHRIELFVEPSEASRA